MNENIIKDILSICSIDGNIRVSSRSNVTYYNLIKGLLHSSTLKEASTYLNISEDSLYKLMSRYVSKSTLGLLKPKNVYWKAYLLNLCNLKECNSCKIQLNLTSFVKNAEHWDGLANACRACRAEYRKIFTEQNPEYSRTHYLSNSHVYKENASRYKAQKIKATPSWANRDKILEIYKSCPDGFHVDHIYPLQSDWVCGLHVETNLRCIPAEDNLRKSNRYIADVHGG